MRPRPSALSPGTPPATARGEGGVERRESERVPEARLPLPTQRPWLREAEAQPRPTQPPPPEPLLWGLLSLAVGEP